MKDSKTRIKNQIKLAVVLFVAVIAMVILILFRMNAQNVVNDVISKTNSVVRSAEGESYQGNGPEGQNGEGQNPESLTGNEQTQKGNVIIKYVDNEGNEIKTSRTIHGPIGTAYTTDREELEGYSTYEKDPLNKIGYFEENDITVVYKYILSSKNVNYANDDNTVTVVVKNNRLATEYKLIVCVQDNNGKKFDNVGINLLNGSGDILKQTKTVNGEVLVGAIVVREAGDYTYKIEQSTQVKEYNRLYDGAFPLNITSVWDEETSKYVVTFNYDRNAEGAIVDIDESAKEVKVTLKLQKQPIYDLSMKKFVTSIDGENVESRAPSISNIEDRNITFTSEKPELHVLKNQNIIYTLRIYNEGNEDLTVPEIVDTIPNGLVFVKNSTINQTYGWQMFTADNTATEDENEAKILKTAYLQSTAINGFELGDTPKYIDLQIELKTANKTASITNKALENVATITAVPNEIDTADNSDSDIVYLEDRNIVIKEYVKQINDVELTREPSATVTYEDVSYTSTIDFPEAESGDKVVLGVKVFNESRDAIEGKEVVVELPEHTRFVPSAETNTTYGWIGCKLEGTTLVETSNVNEITHVKTNYFVKEFTGFDKENIDTLASDIALLELRVSDEKIVEETTVFSKAKIGKIDYETVLTDNEAIEGLKLLRTYIYYNLVSAKFVSKVDDVVITGREPQVTIDENNLITLTKTGEVVRVSNGQKVEFTIRQYNESISPVHGTEVTDIIPDGLIFDKSNSINTQYGWVMYDENGEVTEDETRAKKVKTNYLVTQDEIPAITSTLASSKEVKLVLKVTEEKIKVDTRVVNKAEVDRLPEQPNPDPENPIPPVIPEEELIIEKTKVYDIAIQKFVSKVDDTIVQSRIPTVTVANIDEVTVTKNGEFAKAENGQAIEFTLRVYNVGNQLLQGTEVTDLIPNGLVYDATSNTNMLNGWRMYKKDTSNNLVETTNPEEAVVVKSSKLASEGSINPINGDTVDYKDLKLVLKVTEEKIEADTRVINTARVAEVQNEEASNPNNNESQETVILEKTKVYDLAMAKFVDKVDETVITGREPVVTVTEDGKVIYEKTGEVVTVRNKQKVEFTLRQYNQGNVESNGTEITDYIPEGLIFDKDNSINIEYGWIMYEKDENDNLVETNDVKKARYVKSKKLETESIPAIEGQTVSYKDLKLVLKVTEEKIKVDTRVVNTAKAEKLPKENNPVNPDEPTTPDNNIGEEELIIEKTKVYDLALSKFVVKLDDEEITNRIPTTSVDEDENVAITKNGEIVKAKNNQTVEFVIRMYNVGNQDANGTLVTDNIPIGLIFDKDSEINAQYGWVMYDTTGNPTEDPSKAVTAKTNYFESKQLLAVNGQVVSFENVHIVLKVTNEKIRKDTRIINLAVADKLENEDKPSTGEEELIIEKTKVYDIAAGKFVSAVDGEKIEGREPIATIDGQDNLILTKEGEIVKVSNGQQVEFTIREYNGGNEPIKGTEVIDYIPEGLFFDKNNLINKAYDWKMYTKDENDNFIETEDSEKARYVKTTYLETKDIAKITEEGEVSFVDVKLILYVTEKNIPEDTEVVNIAKVKALPEEERVNPEEPNNNIGEEKLILEKTKQNIALKKFISKVDTTDITNREPVITISSDGKINYNQTEEIVKVANNQLVEFTLRQYNEGNSTAKGVQVIDELPDGLVFIEDNEVNKNYAWKMYTKDEEGNLVETKDSSKATVVKTSYLTEKEIDKFNEEALKPSFLDVKLVLKVDESAVKNSKTRIITNNAKIDTKDKNKEDNEASEKLQVKYFDLKITKYVSKVVIENSEDKTEENFGIDHKGQIYKKDIDAKEINDTMVYVTYTLQVENVGEIAGYVKKLVDYIPSNFELVEDGKWVMGNGIATYVDLAGEEIKPGEKKSVLVTFAWNLEESESIGPKVNEAKVSEYKNEFDAEDITDDNNDKETIIISIRTGAVETFIGFVLIGLVATCVIVFVAKKRQA